MSRERDIEIANEILVQLGGYYRIKPMINLKDHMAVESGLSFKFSGCKKLNYCKIILNSMDTYDIEFGKISIKKEKIPEVDITINHPIYTKVEEINGIYNDQLMDIFEDRTGLYLTLTTRH